MAGETLRIAKHGAVVVGPERLRQVVNDADADVLWAIVAVPEEPGGKIRLPDGRRL